MQEASSVTTTLANQIGLFDRSPLLFTLTSLFDLFGPSVLVERLHGLTLRSAIVAVVYGITAARCRRWIASCTTILESRYDSQVQPWNDGSKSSGVTLLDDYIRTTYRRVEEWGAMSVGLRQGAQP